MPGRPFILVVGLVLTAALWARTATANVVVFPLDPRGVAYDTADRGTKNILSTMRDLKGLRVIDPKTVARKIGVDLTEQAKKCEYDVFCLVEIGEILEGDFVLIGHLRQQGEGADRKLELKLIVLDVARASITEVLIWNVSANEERALDDATRTAPRRLFGASDVKVVWNVEPDDAEIFVYGDPLKRPKPGAPVPYWSGVYHVRLERAGYHPLDQRIRIPQKKAGVVSIDIEMEQDPLYVAKRESGGDVTPFDKSSRREGSGVSAQVVGALPDDDQASSALANPFAWAAVGVGVATIVVGSVVMSGAQSKYNALAQEGRFMMGTAATASIASRMRDDHRSTYTTGSVVVGVGAAAIVGGIVWMLVDAALAEDPEEQSSRMTSLDPASVDRVAAAWAQSLYGRGGP